MQILDPAVQGFQRAIVDNHVVRLRQTLFSAGLRRKDVVDLFMAQPAARLNPAPTQGLRRIDHQHPVDACSVAGFDKQRYRQDTVGAG